MFKRFLQFIAATYLGLAAVAGPALAEPGRVGMAYEKQLNFQAPATEVMHDIIWLHDVMMVIITLIVLLVMGLLLWVMIRYNHRTNPIPSKTTHNTFLEMIWTVIPVLILVYIGVYSIKLLYKQDVIPEADLVIEVTGHQWYWTYNYPDQGLEFDGFMLDRAFFDPDRSPEIQQQREAAIEDLRILLGRAGPIEIHRLLDTDTRVVVPVNTVVKVLVTADDVIHSWTIPAFGFKIDAVPGRTNEIWFNAEEVGTYYGQCSELCGINHAFMPTVVEVVTREDFDAWVIRAKASPAS